jgi:hypothetical protein
MSNDDYEAAFPASFGSGATPNAEGVSYALDVVKGGAKLYDSLTGVTYAQPWVD